MPKKESKDKKKKKEKEENIEHVKKGERYDKLKSTHGLMKRKKAAEELQEKRKK